MPEGGYEAITAFAGRFCRCGRDRHTRRGGKLSVVLGIRGRRRRELRIYDLRTMHGNGPWERRLLRAKRYVQPARRRGAFAASEPE